MAYTAASSSSLRSTPSASGSRSADRARQTVRRALSVLEDEGLIDRQDVHLLKLLAVDGYTYSEAAKALDTTVEACRKRAKRAEQKLRELLGK